MRRSRWREVAGRVRDRMRADNLSLVAAGVAFFALLSLAPAMVATLSLYGLVASPDDVAQHIDDLTDPLPDGARAVVDEQLRAAAEASTTGLSLTLVVGVVFALWGASTAMRHLMVALTAASGGRERLGFVARRAQAVGLTLAGIAFFAATVVLLTVAPSWVAGTGNDVAGAAVAVLRWPVLLALMVFALALVYRYVPERPVPRRLAISRGAVIATFAWLGSSALFSLYTGRFGSYDETYGSLGAVVVLMLWLYITALCVLVGAVIDSVLEGPDP